MNSGQGQEGGGPAPLDQVVSRVYDQLRRLAGRFMHGQRSDHTLQATALVHETFLRLAKSEGPPAEAHANFVALAAKTMRSVLVDHARIAGAVKSGGDRVRVELDEPEAPPAPAPDLVALDEALGQLFLIDERKAKVIELRYFAGLSVEETAKVLGISTATVKRDWSLAKAWLHRELAGDHEDGP